MNKVIEIGQPPWTRESMLGKLEKFVSLYKKRPIKDNKGGMKTPHMFLAQFALQELKPKAIVESGVYLGQGTWLLENACPDAKLYCIDIDLQQIQYKSSQVAYFNLDFSTIDWNSLPKEDTVLFFDDHQNAYERVKMAKWFGFKHLIFEDSYPPLQGDCYSLKKAFMHSGFKFTSTLVQSIKQRIKQLLGIPCQSYRNISPNDIDAKYLRQNIEVYYEFPPVFKTEQTRWNDDWDDVNYPTPEPLLSSVEKKYQHIFLDEAIHYTWMCYVRLKQPS